MAYEFELQNDAGVSFGTLWLGECDRRYVLSEGKDCPMPQAIAWCRNCKVYVAAEEVPSLTTCDDWLQALHSGPEATKRYVVSIGEGATPERYFGDDWGWFGPSQLKHWESVREWRLLRRAPPRCLTCASFEVDLLESPATETIHPITGERLKLKTIAHMKMAKRFRYSIEGLLLPVT